LAILLNNFTVNRSTWLNLKSPQTSQPPEIVASLDRLDAEALELVGKQTLRSTKFHALSRVTKEG
jgi:hypothetical protein